MDWNTKRAKKEVKIFVVVALKLIFLIKQLLHIEHCCLFLLMSIFLSVFFCLGRELTPDLRSKHQQADPVVESSSPAICHLAERKVLFFFFFILESQALRRPQTSKKKKKLKCKNIFKRVFAQQKISKVHGTSLTMPDANDLG